MNSKKELWVLLASFVLPIVFGTAFFYLSPGSFTKSTVNYGEFVNPVISTENQDIVFNDAKNGSLQGIWTLTYVTDRCEQSCQKTLEDMNTIRILTNENMRRIQNLLLTSENVKGINPKVALARGGVDLMQKLKKFPNNHLFLIDPLGNIMLHYNPEELNIKLVIKDLHRLFKYSRIG
jgi:cytochrome oxidase Cu insertion factor (SCO1/SenC/PrrC family)